MINTDNKNKWIKTSLETQRPLSKKVAKPYIVLGKEVGLTRKDLEELSFGGALTGYMKYLEKHSTKKRTFKISTYLTWWMRRAIHIAIIKKLFDMALDDRDRAEMLMLDFLE